MRIPSGLYIDSPAWPLLQAQITYWGITTAAGNAFGTTLVDALCSTAGQQPSYAIPAAQVCKLLTGDAAGQLQVVGAHALGTGTLSFANPFTDYNGAVYQVPAGIRFVILSLVPGGGGPGPLPGPSASPKVSLNETWQDELGIDFTIWTPTNPAGGAWVRGANGAYLRATAPFALNNVGRLRSNQQWIATPDTYGINTYVQKMFLQFEFQIDTVANLDNANCFFGLSEIAAATRVSNNLIGWALIGDVLQSLTDVGGVETVNTAFGENLANWNLLEMEIYAGTVEFTINGIIVASHVANLPDVPMYLNFYFDTEATGGVNPQIGQLGIWYQGVVT